MGEPVALAGTGLGKIAGGDYSMRQSISGIFGAAPIRRRILLGFGAIQLLLVCIALTDFIGSRATRAGLDGFLAVEAENADLGRIVRDFGEAEIAVNKFLISGKADDGLDAASRISAVKGLLAGYDTAGHRGRDRILRMGGLITDYAGKVDELRQIIAEQAATYDAKILKTGPAADQALTTLIDTLAAAGDTARLRDIAHIFEELGHGRTYVQKTMRTGDDGSIAKGTAGLRASLDMMRRFTESLPEGATRQTAATAVASLAVYAEGFSDEVALIKRRDPLVAGRLALAAELRGQMAAWEADSDAVLKDRATTTEAGAALSSRIEMCVAVLAVVLSTVAANVIGRGIAGPVQRMAGAMRQLAAGELDVDIPAARGGELAAMAEAMSVFRESTRKARELAAVEEESIRLQAARAAQIEAATQRFDSHVRDIMQTVVAAAGEVEVSARSLGGTAEKTSSQATAVAAAAEQAAANVQTVAAAAEQLSASIREISAQVTRSADTAGEAAAKARRTDTVVAGLGEAAQRIDDVVAMIGTLARQTNMLALNATIEAARAGEAGKSFTVVAGEVKNLARQTTSSTADIDQCVSNIRGSSAEAADSLRSIAQIVGDINEIAATIAAAVEEQGAATHEIARNVEQAARGTAEVTVSIGEVGAAAGATGQEAKALLMNAEALMEHMRRMRGVVNDFIGEIRAA